MKGGTNRFIKGSDLYKPNNVKNSQILAAAGASQVKSNPTLAHFMQKNMKPNLILNSSNSGIFEALRK